MSAPDTEPEKQAKNHKGPIVGIVVAVAVVLLMLLIWTFMVADSGQTPGDGEADAQPNSVQVEPGETPAIEAPAQ